MAPQLGNLLPIMGKVFVLCWIKEIVPKKCMNNKYAKKQIWFFFKKYYKYGSLVFWINIALVCVLAPLGAIIGLNVQRYTVNAILSEKALSQIIALIIELIIFQCIVGVVLNAVQVCFVDIEAQRIKCSLTREIYEECLRIDYKNFDDAEFYNCYAWTIKEYEPCPHVQRTRMVESFPIRPCGFCFFSGIRDHARGSVGRTSINIMPMRISATVHPDSTQQAAQSMS